MAHLRIYNVCRTAEIECMAMRQLNYLHWGFVSYIMLHLATFLHNHLFDNMVVSWCISFIQNPQFAVRN